jgi:hypothetical protein
MTSAGWPNNLIRYRKLLSVVPVEIQTIRSGAQMPDLSKLRSRSEDTLNWKPRKKKVKGWDGEIDLNDLAASQTPPSEDDASLMSRRALITRGNPDGSATTHVLTQCSLAELAYATHIRVEDAAFALNECGLLLRKRQCENEDGSRNGASAEEEEEEEEQMMVIVSRDMVETVAQQWGLKRMCMDTAHVLL